MHIYKYIYIYFHLFRDDIQGKLKDTMNGSFLVRGSQNKPKNVLIIRTCGTTKCARIIFSDKKCGLSEPPQFYTVPALVDYYAKVPLPNFGTMLAYPISKSKEVRA